MSKIIMVTGASSGFGRFLVEDILERGDIAVATVRQLKSLDDLLAKYGADKLFVIPLDVNNAQQRVDAFSAVEKKFGKLDVVINNAGVVGPLGELEGHDEEAARLVFETNFWGTLAMCKLATKFFRETNKVQGGRLINISSFVGYASLPGCSIYNASKHALESATESFAAELDPAWNIKVTLVEPGQFATNVIKGANSAIDPVHPAYATNPNLPTVGLREFLKDFKGAGDAAKASKVILKVADAKAEDVRLRQPVGSDSVAAIKAGCEKVLKDMDAGQDLAAEADGK